MPVEYDPNVDVTDAEIEAWIGEVMESPYEFDTHQNDVPHAKELAIWEAVTRRQKHFSNVLLEGNGFINTGAEIFQRGGISAAIAMTDAAYNAPDRVYSLIQGGPAATIQQVNVPTGLASGSFNARKVIRLVAGGTTYRFGIASVFEAWYSVPSRGRSKTFSFKVAANKNAGSGSINVRYAILEWTGTADTVTKDVVNDWASGIFTGGNFFASTTLNVLATGVTAITHNTSQQISISATVGVSCNNLIVMVLHQDVPAHASDRIDVSEFGLWLGTYAPTIWVPRDDLALSQRFYCKSYPIDTAPANSVRIFQPAIGTALTTGDLYSQNIKFPVQMRTTPILTFYRPSTVIGADNLWSSFQGGAWAAVTSMNSGVDDFGFYAQGARAGAWTAGNSHAYAGDWAASAEL